MVQITRQGFRKNPGNVHITETTAEKKLGVGERRNLHGDIHIIKLQEFFSVKQKSSCF